MSDDVDRFISTAPRLDFAFAIKATVGPVQDLGQTARGHRRIIDILGGEVHGPRLSGEILPGGADWQIVRPDGTIEVVARYTIRADPRRYGFSFDLAEQEKSFEEPTLNHRRAAGPHGGLSRCLGHS